MTSKTGNKGFTLIEVMLAAAVLAISIVTIQQGFLRSATLLARVTRTLEAQQFASEKLWEAQEGLFYSEDPSPGEGSGSFDVSGRRYDWTVEASPLSQADLYAVRVQVSWPEGGTRTQVTREVFSNSVRAA